jgi:hypothetical protein
LDSSIDNFAISEKKTTRSFPIGASTSPIEAFSNIGSKMISAIWPHYLALIVLLLLVAFGYRRGRSHSLAWSNTPLIALATLSIGPSVCAVILYLAYKVGLAQPGPRGYGFRSFVYSLPIEFALLNWAFVPLYVAGRIWARADSARLAMWFAVVAMSVPNLILFVLAPEMVSGAFDAGQGIGIMQAVLLSSPIMMIWPGLDAIIDGAGDRYWFVLHALTGFLPILGLVAWLFGRLAGSQVPRAVDPTGASSRARRSSE